jgi:type II secretory pathway component PulF
LFFKHLHILLRSGIPLLQALKLLQDKLGPRMAKVNRAPVPGIDTGSASGRSPGKTAARFFQQLAVAAVEAGELSGNLTEVLEALQHYYARCRRN